MEEGKYEILDDSGTVIATDMSLDIALCLIKGYADTWYNEPLKLTIRQVQQEGKNESNFFEYVD